MYKFFEVFKTLRLPEDISVYLEDTEVTKRVTGLSESRLFIKQKMP